MDRPALGAGALHHTMSSLAAEHKGLREILISRVLDNLPQVVAEAGDDIAVAFPNIHDLDASP
jgi:hypothetical protein